MGALVIQKYIDPVHEAYFEKLEKGVITHSQLQGEEHGTGNRPKSDAECLAFIVNPVTAKIQTAIEANQQAYLPISGMVIANDIEKKAQEKIEKLGKSVQDDVHVLADLKIEKEKLPPPNTKKRLLRRIVHIGVGLIAVAECLFLDEGLRTKMPKLAAAFTAGALAIVLGFGAHFAGVYIRAAKNARDRALRILLVLLPALVLFSVIGDTRAAAYNSRINISTETGQVAVPPPVHGADIATLGFLLFAAAVFFSAYTSKTSEETEREEAFDTISKKVALKEGDIHAKRQEIAGIATEAQQQKAQALLKFEYARSFEQRLIALAKEAFESYKEKNLRHRTDGVCPDFFTRIPEFHFTLFFDKAKTN